MELSDLKRHFSLRQCFKRFCLLMAIIHLSFIIIIALLSITYIFVDPPLTAIQAYLNKNNFID